MFREVALCPKSDLASRCPISETGHFVGVQQSGKERPFPDLAGTRCECQVRLMLVGASSLLHSQIEAVQ